MINKSIIKIINICFYKKHVPSQMSYFKFLYSSEFIDIYSNYKETYFTIKKSCLTNFPIINGSRLWGQAILTHNSSISMSLISFRSAIFFSFKKNYFVSKSLKINNCFIYILYIIRLKF